LLRPRRFVVASVREFFVRLSARRREQLQNDKNVAHFLSKQHHETHKGHKMTTMSDAAAVQDVTVAQRGLSMDEVYRRIMMG
jgi:hypothetical protein